MKIPEQFMEYFRRRCCACAQVKTSRNIIMLNQKALTAGKGWGCVVCGLAQDGAIAVICDDCAVVGEPVIQFVVDGYLDDGKQIPIEELPWIPHEHNMALHQDEEAQS